MTESDINLGDIEKKIAENSPDILKSKKKLNPQLMSKLKTSDKKENLRKTFYNFNNIYKVEDYKFLTQKNFNQSQNFDERKHNLLVHSFRNNVNTFLILKKYKGYEKIPYIAQNPNKNKFKQKKKAFEKNEFEEFYRSDIFNDSLQKNSSIKEISNIIISIKIVIFEKDSLKKSLVHKISSESLQNEFMTKFSQYMDLEHADEDSKEISNNLTNIYEEFLKDITKKTLKFEVKEQGQIVFQGFSGNELEEEEKKNKNYDVSILKLKSPLNEIIKEIIESEIPKINFSNEIDENKFIKEFEQPANPPEKKHLEKSTDLKDSPQKMDQSQPIISEKNTNEEDKNKKPSYLEIMLGLRDPENGENQQYDEDIIDKLLNAKDLFEINLDFMKPNVIYPEMPELQFKNDDEKKIFTEIHKWLFEMETELEEENRIIMEFKRNRQWDEAQDIFQKDFPDADDNEDEEDEIFMEEKK